MEIRVYIVRANSTFEGRIPTALRLWLVVIALAARARVRADGLADRACGYRRRAGSKIGTAVFSQLTRRRDKTRRFAIASGTHGIQVHSVGKCEGRLQVGGGH